MKEPGIEGLDLIYGTEKFANGFVLEIIMEEKGRKLEHPILAVRRENRVRILGAFAGEENANYFLKLFEAYVNHAVNKAKEDEPQGENKTSQQLMA